MEQNKQPQSENNGQQPYRPEIWYPAGCPQKEKPDAGKTQEDAPVPPQGNGPAYRNPATGAPQQGGFVPPCPPPYLPVGGGYRPHRPMNNGTRVLIAILSVLLAIFVTLFAVTFSNQKTSEAGQDSSSSSSQPKETESSSRAFNTVPNDGKGTGSSIIIQEKSGAVMSAQNVFSKISPSVVGVLTKLPDEDGNESDSQGTGIIASSDGVILTNAHVIGYSPSADVNVVLPGKKVEYKARILGFDKTSDLAVLKISATGLMPAQFGSENELQVGEQVIAIGNPSGMDYSNSLTGGYVSALDRTIAGHSGNGMTYIQTDAAINPGNSGGPLCNLYGQVVGINSCKIVSTGYEGMGFAIPVSKASTIINQLIHTGYVPGRTRIGITCAPVSQLEMQMKGIPNGLQIFSIDKDSPLYHNGVEKGDILCEFDGKDVTTTDELLGQMTSYKPGDNGLLVRNSSARLLPNPTKDILLGKTGRRSER